MTHLKTTGNLFLNNSKFGNNIKFIAIEGIIAAGKTTLLKNYEMSSKFRNTHRFHILPEPIELWKDVRFGNDKINPNESKDDYNILKFMYEDPKRWAYSMQTWALQTRAMSILNCLNDINISLYSSNKPLIILIERSLYANRIFSLTMRQNNSLNNIEWEMYNKLYNYYCNILPNLNGIIYLDTNVNTAMNRCKLRDRKGESNVTISYQKSLQEKHNEMFNDISKNNNIPYIKLNGNSDILKNETEFNNIIKKLDTFLETRVMKEYQNDKTIKDNI